MASYAPRKFDPERAELIWTGDAGAINIVNLKNGFYRFHTWDSSGAHNVVTLYINPTEDWDDVITIHGDAFLEVSISYAFDTKRVMLRGRGGSPDATTANAVSIRDIWRVG